MWWPKLVPQRGILHCTRLNGAGTCDDKVKALSFRQNMYN